MTECTCPLPGGPTMKCQALKPAHLLPWWWVEVACACRCHQIGLKRWCREWWDVEGAIRLTPEVVEPAPDDSMAGATDDREAEQNADS